LRIFHRHGRASRVSIGSPRPPGATRT
jgi:hypothetical protein